MKIVIDIPDDHKRLIDEIARKGCLLPYVVEKRIVRAVAIGDVVSENATELTPIEDGNPPKCGNYLVQVASTDGTATIEFFDVDHYNGDGTWTHYTVGDTKKVSKNIVAWMPLPKKYVKKDKSDC